jgi:hypothetical protein
MRIRLVRLALTVVAMLAMMAPAALGKPEAARLTKARAAAWSARLPLEFFAGRGRGSAFLAETPGYEFALDARGMTLRLGSGLRRAIVMRPANAAAAVPSGAGRLPGVMNDYSGSDRHAWRSGLPTYARVEQRGLWPGVDAVYEGAGGELEYDFLLAPGADPRAISLRFSGMDRIWRDRRGDLVLSAGGRRVVERVPRAWQTIRGHRVAVAVRWILRGGGHARLRLGGYDHSRRLMIDPQLDYSLYTGYGGVDSVAVGSDGSAYVTGSTSTGYYVQQINPAGTAAVFTSQFSNASAAGIALDKFGNIFVTGTASSSGYPTTANAYKPSSQAPGTFATELTPNGALTSSTLLTTGDTSGVAIAVDANDDAYVAVNADGTQGDVPTTPGAVYTQPPGQQSPALLKVGLSSSGANQLIWGTYTGTYATFITGVAVTSNFAPVVSEWNDIQFSLGGGGGSLAHSAHWPSAVTPATTMSTVALVQPSVTEFNNTATQVKFSQISLPFVGQLSGIAISGAGDIYVSGTLTGAQDNPAMLAGCPSSGAANQSDCTGAAELSPSGQTIWATSLSSTSDTSKGIAVDASGDVFLTGSTGSTTFPTTTGAMQAQNQGGDQDAYLTELDPTGHTLLYSTLFGGLNDDYANTIGLAPDGGVILGGSTGGGLPITSGSQRDGGGGFVAKLTPANRPLATTEAATSVTTDSATLNGYTDPRGGIDATYFEYGTSPSYGSQTSPQFWQVATSVHQTITNLQPGQIYHYRVVADHYGIESDGADETFTTEPAAYSGPVITESPQDVTVDAGQPATFTAAATGSDTQTPIHVWQVSTDGGQNFSLQSDADGTQCVSTSTPYTTQTSLSTQGSTSCPAGSTASGGTGLGLPDSLSDNGLEFEVSFETQDGQTVTSDPATLTVIAAPTTTTTAVAAVDAAGATLSGTINPNGSDATYHFEYGTSPSLSTSTSAAAADAGAGRTATNVTTGISGLSPDTTYYYRLVAGNQAGPGTGTIQSFTTAPPGGPVPVITQQPQDVTVIAGRPATFSAAATGSPYAARGWEESTDGGKTFIALPSDDGTQCVSNADSSSPATTTTLSTMGDVSCPAGSNAAGGSGLGLPDSLADNGLEFAVSFETPNLKRATSRPVALTVIAAPATATTGPGAVTASGAKLAGTINPNGSDSTYHFEYGTSPALTSSTPSHDAGAGRSSAGVSAVLSGLRPDTTYYYRLVSTNQAGPGAGGTLTFTTATSTGPAARITIKTSHAAVADHRVKIKLACAGASGSECRGTLKLTNRVGAPLRRHLTWTTRTLGLAVFTIKAGRTALVTVKLSTLARTLLAAAHGHGLRVTATATGRATQTSAVKHTVTLSRVPPGKARAKHHK